MLANLAVVIGLAMAGVGLVQLWLLVLSPLMFMKVEITLGVLLLCLGLLAFYRRERRQYEQDRKGHRLD